MARLRRGFRKLNEEADAGGGAGPGPHATHEARARAANPNRTPPGQPTQGDYNTLEQFRQEHDLRKN